MDIVTIPKGSVQIGFHEAKKVHKSLESEIVFVFCTTMPSE